MKACTKCKLIVENENRCPNCGSEDLSEKFSGLVIILSPEKSEIAKMMNIFLPGRYAIRVE